MTFITQYKKVAASKLPMQCYMDEPARRLSGEIEYRADQEDALGHLFRLRTHIYSRLNPEKANIHVTLSSPARVTLAVSDPGPSFRIGENSSGEWHVVYFKDADVVIGDGTTSNGVKVMAWAGKLHIGSDCMFSDTITIHLGDNHGVIDTKTGKIINGETPEVVISDHVWCGAGARILKGVRIGKGSIIAAGAVVPGKVFPECCVIAGNPAQIKRTDTSWTRSAVGSEWPNVKSRFDLPGHP